MVKFSCRESLPVEAIAVPGAAFYWLTMMEGFSILAASSLAPYKVRLGLGCKQYDTSACDPCGRKDCDLIAQPLRSVHEDPASLDPRYRGV